MPLYSGAQLINVFAGGGTLLGDGGPAIGAEVYDPCSGVFDLAGNYYFASPGEQRVRKIDVTGIISTVAGTGSVGYNGDSIIATTAQLNEPNGVALDGSGNLFIVEAGNNRVRKLDFTTGLIYTVVGNGTAGFGGDSGPATSAMISDPQCVRFDKFGNMYIGDYGNARVRKVTPAGIISTFAGNGIAGFSGNGTLADTGKIGGVEDICVDTSGNVYLADLGNSRVFKINTTGVITTVAGTAIGYLFNGDDIPATTCNLDPYFVCLDDSGYLYIGENQNYRVRKIDAAGIIHTVAGNGILGSSGEGGLAIDAELYHPNGLAFDHCGNLYIPESNNARISKVTFNTSGTPTIGITTPVDTVCAGTAVTFTTSVSGSTTFAYKWVVNGSVVAATGSSYTYTPANGDSVRCILAGTGDCSGAADTVSSNTIHMVVDAPVVPVITLSGTAAAITGSAVTLTASITPVALPTGSYTVKWYNNGTLFSTTTSPITTCTVTTGANNITATIIPAIACTDSAATAAAFIIKASPEGISTVTAQQQVSIYPNPAHNEIIVTGNGLSIITISNTIGQIVQTRKAAATQERIDISSLPPGIYLVTVTGTDGSRAVSKVIKQ